MKRVLYLASWAYLAILLCCAIVLPAQRPFDRQIGPVMSPPSAQFPLGLDERGYDVLSRLAYGARISLGVGLSVQGLALIIGLALGLLAVYGHPWLRMVILRMTDAMFAFPDILLAILIIGIWQDTSIRPIIIALAVSIRLGLWARRWRRDEW